MLYIVRRLEGAAMAILKSEKPYGKQLNVNIETLVNMIEYLIHQQCRNVGIEIRKSPVTINIII